MWFSALITNEVLALSTSGRASASIMRFIVVANFRHQFHSRWWRHASTPFGIESRKYHYCRFSVGVHSQGSRCRNQDGRFRQSANIVEKYGRKCHEWPLLCSLSLPWFHWTSTGTTCIAFPVEYYREVDNIPHQQIFDDIHQMYNCTGSNSNHGSIVSCSEW